MKFVPGQEIGSYRVVRALGKGGMGEVYEVEHVRLGEHYALKTFVLDHGSVDLLRKRFVAEGKVLARLRHPNIARVFELDYDVLSGSVYYVMDLVRGKNGAARSIADLGPDEIGDGDPMRWFRQLCSALDYIHSKGIVHRDVKPANILIDADGNAVLTDFGISRYMNEDLRRQLGVTGEFVNGKKVDVTRQMVLGTEAFMAPEVRLGRGAVPASDAYSLGMVFFELLTGVTYDPHPGVFNLLEPLGGDWAKLLPPLLDDNPEARPVSLTDWASDRPPKTVGPSRWRIRIGLCVGLAALLGIACGMGFGTWFLFRRAVIAAENDRLDRLIEEKLAQERGKFMTQMQEMLENQSDGKNEAVKPSEPVKPPEPVKPLEPNKPPEENESEKDKDIVQVIGQEEEDSPGVEKCTFDLREIDLTMIWCNAGTVRLGSVSSEAGRFPNESIREVKLTRDFWLSKTEITQQQWCLMMDGQTVCDLFREMLKSPERYESHAGEPAGYDSLTCVPADADPRKWCGEIDDAVPVYHVSWVQAMEFCRKLTDKCRAWIPEGYEFRLPTEAEWEYACRAGSVTPLPEGGLMTIVDENNSPELEDYAWYGGNSSLDFSGCGFWTDTWKGKSHPGGKAAPRHVATRKPNGWGFCDMLGNVIEWCYDWYEETPHPAADSHGPDYGQFHVVKGGSWKMGARFCRPAWRDGFPPVGLNFIGFRVALAPKVGKDR